MKLKKINLICIINCTTSKKRTEIWTIDFFLKFLNLNNLNSAGMKTDGFLLAGACDSYVPYVRCVRWKVACVNSTRHKLHYLDLFWICWTTSLTSSTTSRHVAMLQICLSHRFDTDLCRTTCGLAVDVPLVVDLSSVVQLVVQHAVQQIEASGVGLTSTWLGCTRTCSRPTTCPTTRC